MKYLLSNVLFALIEQGESDPLLRPLIARSWLVDGDAEACLAYIDALPSACKHQRLFLIKAECALLLRDYEKSLRILDGLSFKNPARQAECFFVSGVALFFLERYGEAASCLKEAEKGNHQKNACFYYLGEIAFHNEKYKESVSLLRRALSGGYKREKAIIRLAYAAFRADMLLIAVEGFREVLRIDPGFIDAYNNLGIIYARQGRTDDAAAVLKEGLERAPEDQELHYNLSLVYEGALRKQSRDHYRRFRELEALAGKDVREA